MWDKFLNFVDDILNAFKGFGFRDVLDIILVAILIYYLIRLMRDTKATQLAKGILLIVAIYIVVLLFDLKTMEFIIRGALTLGLTALVVVFQPELRRALEQMGRFKMSGLGFGVIFSDEYLNLAEEKIDIIVSSAKKMAIHKTGALIVLERTTRLKDIMSTGTMVNADISEELILNIFFINSPLHDGAMIISDFRIAAAGCYLPISEDMSVSKELGTRHRAALGMSEQSDALIIVVSEETGQITVAKDGILTRNISSEALKLLLEKNLLPEEKEVKNKKVFWRKK